MSLSDAEFAALAPFEQEKVDPSHAHALWAAQEKAYRAAHPIPPSVRMAVHERAKGCCEDCHAPEPLELHHTTYNLAAVTDWHRDEGNSIFGYETPNVLRALCRSCHLDRHLVMGEFYADPEEAEAERDYISHMLRD
jgi:hypothetical protein